MLVLKSTYNELRTDFDKVNKALAQRVQESIDNNKTNLRLHQRIATLTEENTKLEQANQKLLDETADFNIQIDSLTNRYNALQQDFDTYKTAVKLADEKKKISKKKTPALKAIASEPKPTAKKKK